MSSHIPIRNKELSTAQYGDVSWLAEMFTITPRYKLLTQNQIWLWRPDTKPHHLNNIALELTLHNSSPVSFLTYSKIVVVEWYLFDNNNNNIYFSQLRWKHSARLMVQLFRFLVVLVDWQHTSKLSSCFPHEWASISWLPVGLLPPTVPML